MHPPYPNPVSYIMDFNPSYLLLLQIFISIILLYSLAKGIYRITFHPLHSFPGPTLASITNWHKFYYNWYLGGLHSQKIKEWHSRYGPIIRIAPNELHFSSPSAYRAIYTHPDLQKELEFYKFMTEDSLVGQVNVEYHKINRRLFAGYFSTNAIRAQGDVNGALWRKVNQLCDSLRLICGQGGGQTTMNIIHIARCFSYDVIREFVLEPSDTLSTTSPAFNPPFVVANANITKSIRFAQQFPVLVPVVRALPDAILQMVSQDLLAMKKERLVHLLHFFPLIASLTTSIELSNRSLSLPQHHSLHRQFTNPCFPKAPHQHPPSRCRALRFPHGRHRNPRSGNCICCLSTCAEPDCRFSLARRTAILLLLSNRRDADPSTIGETEIFVRSSERSSPSGQSHPRAFTESHTS